LHICNCTRCIYFCTAWQDDIYFSENRDKACLIIIHVIERLIFPCMNYVISKVEKAQEENYLHGGMRHAILWHNDPGTN
jgi:hypothetical protein